jgi:hypothetical protein
MEMARPLQVTSSQASGHGVVSDHIPEASDGSHDDLRSFRRVGQSYIAARPAFSDCFAVSNRYTDRHGFFLHRSDLRDLFFAYVIPGGTSS